MIACCARIDPGTRCAGSGLSSTRVTGARLPSRFRSGPSFEPSFVPAVYFGRQRVGEMINGDARPCFGRVSNASDLKRIRVLLLEMSPMLLDIVTNIVASQDDIDVIAKAQDEPD